MPTIWQYVYRKYNQTIPMAYNMLANGTQLCIYLIAHYKIQWTNTTSGISIIQYIIVKKAGHLWWHHANINSDKKIFLQLCKEGLWPYTLPLGDIYTHKSFLGLKILKHKVFKFEHLQMTQN